ncbi:MAG: alpha/beta hydrolase [Hyphomonadaceae bacterium]
MTATRRGALGAVLGGSAAMLHSTSAQAQAAAQGYVVPFTTVIPITSRINGVDYLLYVRRPASYDAGDARYPVIVTLDADYSFSICANHLEHLAARRNQAPDAILLSIAIAGVYPDLDRYHLERTRDYSPIFVAEAGPNTRFQHVSGGGPAFVRVMEEEIFPLIESRFRIDPSERTLVGHSLGGLFACWMLQMRPDLFNRFLAVSPSLWYADKWIFDRERELSGTRLPRRTRIYLGVGSWEEQPENNGFMASECIAFASMLAARRDPNLEVEQRTFEDETHASIFPAAFSTGIRHLFSNARPA